MGLRNEKNLELLKKEDAGGVRLEGVIELEASIEQANVAIVEASNHLAPAAGTARDLLPDNIIVFLAIRNNAFRGVLLLEELELPPLIH